MATLLDAVRRPEYTGERRCWPCTTVNAALVALASAATVAVSVPAAVVVAALGSAGIALRGYVVPYTPRFAPRIAAVLPGDLFHDEPGPSDSLGAAADGEGVLAALTDAGVVVPEGETLFLDDGFRATWREEVAALREMDDDALAAAVDDAAVRTAGARVDRLLVSLDGQPRDFLAGLERDVDDSPLHETRLCGGPSNPREGPQDVLACADCGERLHTF
ncbi:hypothetical protein BRD03_14265 [Halobacteriales archaeon QS_9_68_17]|nr:MAG: hypothetical protein BRD03_14265 [Halobacteriales archaeon QS_9_68_17]